MQPSRIRLIAVLACSAALMACAPPPASPTTATAPVSGPTMATSMASPAQSPTELTSVPPNPLLRTDPPVDATMQPLVLPELPAVRVPSPITVNAGGAQSISDAEEAALQKLADDLAAGNVNTIVANCWTQPAQDVRQVYADPAMRATILDALQNHPVLTQAGAMWQNLTTGFTVNALWEELDSQYPCPTITWGSPDAGLGTFTPAMAEWRIARALAIHDGTPVHEGDGQAYTVLCDRDCGAWSPHNPNGPGVEAPIAQATPEQWQRLRELSNAPIAVERLVGGYYRVRAADGSTNALAYFTGSFTDTWLPYELGEID